MVLRLGHRAARRMVSQPAAKADGLAVVVDNHHDRLRTRQPNPAVICPKPRASVVSRKPRLLDLSHRVSTASQIFRGQRRSWRTFLRPWNSARSSMPVMPCRRCGHVQVIARSRCFACGGINQFGTFLNLSFSDSSCFVLENSHEEVCCFYGRNVPGCSIRFWSIFVIRTQGIVTM